MNIRVEFRFIDELAFVFRFDDMERSLRMDLSFMIPACNIGLRCLCFPAEKADGEA